MRKLSVLALCVWLAMLSTIALSAWFWRTGVLRPHAAWALATLVAVIGSATWLSVLAFREVWRAGARSRATGWWLVGTTPLVWFAAFATGLYVDAMGREPLTIDTPVRIVATWGSSFFDIEARLRYPRWTHGRHVILLDSGQIPAAQVLVEKMDEHVSSMIQLLGQQPFSSPIAWVRGSIFGMQGRAFAGWAICGPGGSATELDQLDRHEVAHATIESLASPEHDPPFLLVEGWAETQSQDRNHQIRSLAEKQKNGETYALAELIGPNWYGRPSGPIYWQGGPLVHYLMEHFGPEKFFELYNGARRATFRKDCQRILGASWDEVEQDFWTWIEAEGKALAVADATTFEAPPKWKLEFAEGVNEADWQRLVDGYRRARRNAATFPERAAFIARWEWARTELSNPDKATTYHSDLSTMINGDGFWIWSDDGSEVALLATDGRCASLTRSDSGAIDGWVADSSVRARAQREAAQLIGVYRESVAMDPASYLPIGGGYTPEATYRVERIMPPTDPEQSTWKVVVQIRHDKTDGDDQVDHTRYELTIDPDQDWWITRMQGASTAGSRLRGEARYRQWGGMWLPATGTFDADYVSETVSSRIHMRSLTSDEQHDLQRRVEHLAEQGPTRPYHRLRTLLIAMVFAWPAVGAVLLAWPSRPKHSPSFNNVCPDRIVATPPHDQSC